MSQNPRVSVVIPSFNRARLSLRAISSVLNQSYKNVELIFVNDGSGEDYQEVGELLAKSGAKYFKTPNQGVSSARNLGISQSNGDYIAFLDSDDEWLEDKLAKQVEILLENPDLKIIQGLERWIRNEKVLVVPEHLKPAHGESFKKAIEYCCIGPSSVLLKRELLDELGVFDPNLRVCEDYDLWLRVLDKYPVYCIQEELSIKYAGHKDQLSKQEEAMDRFRVYALLKYLKSAPSIDKRSLVVDSVNKRLKILIAGADKRGLSDRVELYKSIEIGHLVGSSALSSLIS